MTRTVNASTISALNSDGFRWASLMSFYFGTSTVHFTDYGHSITYSATTYSAINGFLDLSDPSESSDLRVNTLTAQMSGAEQSFISIFLSENWINRRALLQKAVIDSSGSVIGAPIVVFDGLISNFGLQEGEKSSVVTISVSSHWADFNKRSGRYTNNNSQQYFFAGDLGFSFAAETVSDLKWGRA